MSRDALCSGFGSIAEPVQFVCFANDRTGRCREIQTRHIAVCYCSEIRQPPRPLQELFSRGAAPDNADDQTDYAHQSARSPRGRMEFSLDVDTKSEPRAALPTRVQPPPLVAAPSRGAPPLERRSAAAMPPARESRGPPSSLDTFLQQSGFDLVSCAQPRLRTPSGRVCPACGMGADAWPHHDSV